MHLDHRAVGLLIAGAASLVACGGNNEPNHAPASIALVSGNNQTGTVGATLAEPLFVEVVDRGGDPVAGVAVQFEVTSGGGSVSGSQVSTGTSGLAGVTWTLGTLLGPAQVMTARVAGLSGSPVSFAATGQASMADTIIVLSGSEQTAEVGSQLPAPIVVELHDVFGNLVAGGPMNWTVISGGGSVPTATTLSDASGQGTMAWTLGWLVGLAEHGLRIRAGTAETIVTAAGTLSSGTLAIASGNAQAAGGDQQLPAALGVRVRTTDGHDVGGVPIDWAITSGGGSVTQAASITDGTGLATTRWTLGGLAGSQSASASNATLSPTSVEFVATALVPEPSTIRGTVIIAGSALRAPTPRVTRRGFLRPEPTGRLARSQGRLSTTDLLVSFRPASIQSPGLRAMANANTALVVGQAMRVHLSRYLVAGLVDLAGISPLIHTARLRVDPARLDSVARSLAQDPAFVAVQPDRRLYANDLEPAPLTRQPAGVIPNDPNFPSQSWHYSMIDLPRAWSITTGSASIIVAVLDNGIVFHHPAIGGASATYQTGGGNLRSDGYDFVPSGIVPLCAGGETSANADGDGYDPDPSLMDDRAPSFGCLGDRLEFGGHGLHVAATVGAMGNDGVSVTGINWASSIRPVRVLGLDGGMYYDIAQGVLYAGGLPADNGSGGVLTPPAQPARIINMSLGGGCLAGGSPAPGTDPLHDAVVAVTDPARPNGGVLVVAAAGNSASSQVSCPGAYPEVLAVGAVGPAGTRTAYSNFGPWVDIAAPGGETAAPDATYWVYSAVCNFTVFPAPCIPGQARNAGTSMASPHVAGVAALLLAQNPGLTPADLRARLTGYVTPIDPGQQIGPGIVNARNGLTQTSGPSRQLYVSAYNATTGAPVSQVAAPGGVFSIPGLADGSYFVFGGEDEGADGAIGLPDRRFGAAGGAARPVATPVSASAGAVVSFSVGSAVEAEPDETAVDASRLVLGGSIRGIIDLTTDQDLFRVDVPTAGTYTFETAGWYGGFCSYALDVNTTLELLDAAMGSLEVSVDINPSTTAPGGNNYCSRISRSLTAGTYYLRVSPGNLFDLGTHVGRYTLMARAGP